MDALTKQNSQRDETGPPDDDPLWNAAQRTGRLTFAEVRKMAQGFYEATWKQSNDPLVVRSLLDDYLYSEGLDGLVLALGEGSAASIGLITDYQIISQWPMYGHPHVILGAQRTASFALTKIQRETVEDLPFPWDAFFITLPENLLTVESPQTGEQESIDRISVLNHICQPNDPVLAAAGIPAGEQIVSWVATTPSGVQLCRGCMRLDNFVDPIETGERGFYDYHMDDQDARVMVCIDKIIVGVCLYMQDPDVRETAKKRTTGKTARKKRLRFPVGLDNYSCPDTVVVDAREVLREYVGKGGKSPIVRSYVRPHWHRFRTGKGRKNVTLKYLEGYMKGPRGAPMKPRNMKIPEPRA